MPTDDAAVGTSTLGTFETIEQASATLQPVMRAIAAAVGPYCEVVLHDLEAGDLLHSIVAIENGHVTGRSVGGPSTNLGVNLLDNESAEHNDFGYRARTADGRELHSSSVYFRNSAGRVIAALCVNVDLTPWQVAESAIRTMLPTADAELPAKELVAADITSVLDEMVSSAVAKIGKAVPLMDKSDRMAVLRELETRGAFRVRRAVDQVAKHLGISRVTAYGYLDEIRHE